ncbi:MAG: VOC family protein [Acidimicrobiia bacterium]|nr:VOC family protein [Acidimicrobiia bacterium]
MAERVGTVSAVVINVRDLEKEQKFWMEFLGVGVAREVPGFFVWLEPQHKGGISVALQLAEEIPEVRNPVHLDNAVHDLETAAARIVELGGSFVEDHEIFGFSWKVMADPEGNEFCIAQAE